MLTVNSYGPPLFNTFGHLSYTIIRTLRTRIKKKVLNSRHEMVVRDGGGLLVAKQHANHRRHSLFYFLAAP